MNTYTKLAFHLLKAANIKTADATTAAIGRYVSTNALNGQSLADNPIRAAVGNATGLLLPAALGALLGKGSTSAGFGDPYANPVIGAVAGAGISSALGGPEYMAKLLTQGLTEKSRKRKVEKAHHSLLNSSTFRNGINNSLSGALICCKQEEWAPSAVQVLG